jgi:O-antigen/teichoic acid export membrane protein
MSITRQSKESSASAHRGLVRRIDYGIRVTFFLSIITIPISYLTQVLLARTSVEAVGIFGAIVIWATFAQSFYYIGGNAVLIKFLPEIPNEAQLQFLISYGVLVFLITTPGVLLIAFLPTHIRSLIGQFPSYSVFVLLLIALANVYQQMLLAALKGMLELAIAQVLTRIVTIGQFVAFGALLLFAKTWFQAHLVEAIVTAHLGVVGLSLALAGIFAMRDLKPTKHFGSLHLPPGFWRFSLLFEVAAVVTFFTRLDQVLVLLYTSIAGLGIYFLLAQMASAAQLVSSFFLDSMLPAFTNVWARMGPDATRQVYEQGARLNQIIVTGSTLVLLCFNSVILSTFGAHYRSYWPLFLVLVVFSGLNSLGGLNNFLLTSANRVHLILMAQAIQVVTFLALFRILNGKQSLFMLALAQGLATTAGLAGTILATTLGLRIGLRVPREFWVSAAIILVAGAVAARAQYLSLLRGTLLFFLSLPAFFILGRYRRDEIFAIIGLLRPSRAAKIGSSPSRTIFTIRT